MRSLRPLLSQRKLGDEETGEIYWTNVACRLLRLTTCLLVLRNRHDFVPDCVELDVEEVVTQTYTWLPPSLHYRVLAAGKVWRGGILWCAVIGRMIHASGFRCAAV